MYSLTIIGMHILDSTLATQPRQTLPISHTPFLSGEKKPTSALTQSDHAVNELPWRQPSPASVFLDEVALGNESTTSASHPYRFACAQELETKARAAELVSRRYRWRGYGEECGDALLRPAQPTQMTFIATRGTELVGTVSARMDGASPMNCEALYPDVVQEKRQAGQKLVELGQLAIDNDQNPLEILGPLFHLTMLFAHHQQGASHALIEVNPRHVAFYRRVFGFRIIGTERHCDRVNAPAVLMQMDLAQAQQAIALKGGTRQGRSSVFPYCFSIQEQDSIAHSLLGH